MCQQSRRERYDLWQIRRLTKLWMGAHHPHALPELRVKLNPEPHSAGALVAAPLDPRPRCRIEGRSGLLGLQTLRDEGFRRGGGGWRWARDLLRLLFTDDQMKAISSFDGEQHNFKDVPPTLRMYHHVRSNCSCQPLPPSELLVLDCLLEEG